MCLKAKFERCGEERLVLYSTLARSRVVDMLLSADGDVEEEAAFQQELAPTRHLGQLEALIGDGLQTATPSELFPQTDPNRRFPGLKRFLKEIRPVFVMV